MRVKGKYSVTLGLFDERRIKKVGDKSNLVVVKVSRPSVEGRLIFVFVEKRLKKVFHFGFAPESLLPEAAVTAVCNFSC